jgi:uncharacterized protein (TIGR02145 family)
LIHIQNEMKIDIKYEFCIFAGIICSIIILMILTFQSCKKLEIERIVKLNTGEPTEVTAHSALVTGVIFDISEDGITQYGHCWSTTENPLAEFDTKTNLGNRNSTGNFSSGIDGLEHATIYYVRAYAISNGKTTYGNMISFRTDEIGLPEVSTDMLSNITYNTGTYFGNVTFDGGGQVTARGVCWNTNPNPAMSDFHTLNGSGTGSFSGILTGLAALTSYYIRAYATNEAGTAYGNEVTFRSAAPPVSDIDGNTYNSVSIGSQIWMKENLKTTRFRNGTSIPNVLNDNDWNALAAEAYCWYNNEVSFKSEYGALYDWYAVQTQQICPTGWHVPSDQEWTTLIDFLGGLDVAGEKLKETDTEHWWSPNPASNETGFTALPGGYRNWSGIFLGMGEYGSWWTTTLSGATDAYHWDMYSNASIVYKNIDARHLGFSVRCIRDE